MLRVKFVATLLAVVALSACATSQLKPDPRDPWERLNRGTFAVNDGLDRAIAKPLARTYRKVTPEFAQVGFYNFIQNLRGPRIIINNLLQGDLRESGRATGRFLLNTVVGVGGFLDPATAASIDASDEDLGQTFGKWGVPPGPFLMLPIFGPSTVRDTVGLYGDRYADPVTYIDDDVWRYGFEAARFIARRARLLPASDVLDRSFDRYAFLRNAYLQQREFAVRNGNIEETPADEGIEFDDGTEAPLSEPPPGTDPPAQPP